MSWVSSLYADRKAFICSDQSVISDHLYGFWNLLVLVSAEIYTTGVVSVGHCNELCATGGVPK